MRSQRATRLDAETVAALKRHPRRATGRAPSRVTLTEGGDLVFRDELDKPETILRTYAHLLAHSDEQAAVERATRSRPPVGASSATALQQAQMSQVL